MIGIIDAIIYGVIQGLTEFLPISSSGHLALLPHFINFKDPGMAFDLFMHFGTAIAIIFYFKEEVIQLAKGAVETIFNKNPDPWFLNFTIATVATVIGILIFRPFANEFGRIPIVIAMNLILFGLLLFVSDLKGEMSNGDFDNPFEKITFPISVLIGFFQSFAIFPGVSRSGVTITAARFKGLNRIVASRFSFLLSLPIIIGGILEKLLLSREELSSSFSVESLFVGVVVSFIVGLLTIHFFLKFIAKVDFVWFFIYRFLLGLYLIYIFGF